MLPNSVGNLVQLRYLDFSKTRIKSLPDTTCNLYNLQTLILSSCGYLTELPVHIGKLVNLRHLDVSSTNIKEMPMQIVELENLRTSTLFVMGKQQVGLSVREIRKFPHLQGKLFILNLHNVIDVMDVYDANLKSKEQIEELELKWGKETEDSQIEKVVLDQLQPSLNLKKLNIFNYGGTSFPSWLGDSLFSNMVSLCIKNCEYCITLPPLGQLPSLKKLKVSGMKLVETIGREFFGTTIGGSISSFQPFPSLEHLEFMYMSNWKEWLPFESGDFCFPCLKTLQLIRCPELRGHLPNQLPSIEEIILSDCDHLLATPPTLHWLSSIKKIVTFGGTQWPLLGSDSPCLLQEVQMGNCDTLLSLPKMILSSGYLRHLILHEIPSLTAFPADGLSTSLQSLTIDRCKNLAFLPPETWCKYTSLVTLDIFGSCHSLASFPLDGFPALQDLHIDGCSSLESIFILESSSLLPSSLQTIWVESCDTLRSLPRRMDTLTALEHLFLSDLPELELSFCEGACLPPKLRTICIESVKVSTMGITEWGLQRLTAFSNLLIEGDDIVNALLKGRLLPISLVNLGIANLSNMKSLDGSGLRHLTSLESLLFQNCPRLESLPADTLPSSLKELSFDNCPRLESLPEDTLPSSLKELSIRECPLLEARYESQIGEHWSNIVQIPVLIINDRVII